MPALKIDGLSGGIPTLGRPFYMSLNGLPLSVPQQLFRRDVLYNDTVITGILKDRSRSWEWYSLCGRTMICRYNVLPIVEWDF